MADNINNIIDVDGTHEAVQAVINDLVATENQIKKVNELNVKVQVDAQSTSSLSDLQARFDALAKSNEAYTETLITNAKATESLNIVTQQATATTSGFTKAQIDAATASGSMGKAINNTANQIAGLQNVVKNITLQMSAYTSATQKTSAAYQTLATNLQNAQSKLNALQPPLQQTVAATTNLGVSATKASTAFTIFGVNIESTLARMTVRMIAMQLLFVPIIAGVTALAEWWTKVDESTQRNIDRVKDYFDSFSDFQKQKKNTPIEVEVNFKIKKADFAEYEKLMKEHIGTGDIQKAYNDYQHLAEIGGKVLDQVSKEDFMKKGLTAQMEKQLKTANEYLDIQTKLAGAEKDRQGALTAQTSNIDKQKQLTADIVAYAKTSEGQIDFGYGVDEKPTNEQILKRAQTLISTKDRDTKWYRDSWADKVAQLNQAQEDQKANNEDIGKYMGSVSDLQRQADNLEANSRDKKPPKPKKPNAKDINASLREENERYLAELAIAKKEFDDKERLNKAAGNNEAVTYTHQQELLKKQESAVADHFQIRKHIMEAFYSKTGETAEQWHARISKDIADQLEENNKLAENSDKNSEAYKKDLQEKKEALEQWQKYVDETTRKFIAIEDAEANAKAAAKIDHDYASGAGGFLEGLGIENTDYAAKQKQLELQKNAKLKDAADAQNSAEKEKAKDLPDQKEIDTFQLQANQATLDAANIGREQQAEQDNLILEQKKKIGAETIELAQQTFDAINTIRNNSFAAEQQQLEIQMREIQLQSQQKIAAINASAGFQITKENEAAKVVAQTTAQENSIQQQQNQLALKKAKADKQAAESGIELNTALALAKVLPQFADPVTLPFAIAETALITSIGAVQYAAAASTPLPQFFTGGVTDTPVFSAAERGRELGQTPSGDMILFDQPGTYSAEPGTRIFNNEDTERMIRYSVNNVGVLEAIPAITWDDSKMLGKLDDLIESNLYKSPVIVKTTVVVKGNRRFPHVN